MTATNETVRPLGDHGAKILADRNLDLETAVRLGFFTAAKNAAGDMVPDIRGKVMGMPFFHRGKQVGVKYRTLDKRFWQEQGGWKTFFNADVLDDPALQTGKCAAIVVEGEYDLNAVAMCGFHTVISVPDGAPSVPKHGNPEDLEPIDSEKDASGKYEYIYNNRDRLLRIKRFIIAVDNDPAGKRLAAELARRFGEARSWFVTYPGDAVVKDGDAMRACKDMNEVLQHFGREGVEKVINGAKPYPVHDLYELDDYPDVGPLATFAVGWDNWGAFLRVCPGELMVVSGIPSQGKTAWTVDLVCNLARTHGWKTTMCSPEMPVVPILRDMLTANYLGRTPQPLERDDIGRAHGWVKRHFNFIATNPNGESDQAFDVDWIIERAHASIIRKDIKVLLIDPWNELELSRAPGESNVDYIGQSLRKLKRFGQQKGVMVIVVCHPTKDVMKDGKTRLPRLYDCEGAAHWFNKADHGIIVERPDLHRNDAVVHIQKVRWKGTGRIAKMHMTFNPDSGAFTPAYADES